MLGKLEGCTYYEVTRYHLCKYNFFYCSPQYHSAGFSMTTFIVMSRDILLQMNFDQKLKNKSWTRRNWDDTPSINIWTFPTTFQINWTCQVILWIQESHANRNLSDASVVIVIGKDFTSLSSIDLRYTYAVNKLNDLCPKNALCISFCCWHWEFLL